ELELTLRFERYYASGLGRFKIWVSTEEKANALDFPGDLETYLHLPTEKLSNPQKQALLQHFLMTTPELAKERQKIDDVRKQLPAYPTTLVLQERPPENPRPTPIHHRGEFLHPTEKVQAELLSIFPPMAKEVTHNRLNFARWLVSPDNPLVGRVTMN